MDQRQVILFGAVALVFVWLMAETSKRNKKHLTEEFVDRVSVTDHLAPFNNCRKRCLLKQLQYSNTNAYVQCLKACSKNPDFY